MIRTLIVDDDSLIHVTLRSLIDWESCGYTVVQDCAGGNQALSCLMEHPVDLLITDIKMPGMDGLELMRQLRQSGSMPVTVVLSGYDEFELVREAFRLGAYDYLLKGNISRASLTRLLSGLRQKGAIQRAKEFMQDNFTNPELMLKTVADYVGFNEKYFSTRFTRECGCTFINYLNDLRLKRAQELLIQTDMKIYEISDAVGYSSVEHFNHMFKKKLLSALLASALTLSLLAGCGGGNGTAGSNPPANGSNPGGSGATAADLKGDLVFAIWDNNLLEYIEANDMEAKFQETYPNINVEVEKIKDDSEYWNSMKMRASANQLPDVMFNKPFTLSRFQDYLLDLSDTEACKNNTLAQGYALNGKVLGIPMTAGYEYVYYWKDMFQEAGVQVPTTWEELKDVSKKLQDYYGAKDPDFMAIALGAKDEWPTYPYMEFMPALISGNGQNWNDMAKTDTPFASGTDINTAYHRVYDLFTSGVLGKDPLGMSKDQVTNLFGQKKAAITALGDWGLQDISGAADSTDQLGTFYLPVRESTSEPFRYIVQGDSFMGVTTHSKSPEAAKAFVEWFYSEAWYPGYINYVSSASSMSNFPKDKDPILAEADAAQPDGEMVMYDGGGDDFTALQNETPFDYKKLGAQMLTNGFDLDAALADLDAKWTAARAKLGIQ